MQQAFYEKSAVLNSIYKKTTHSFVMCCVHSPLPDATRTKYNPSGKADASIGMV